MGIISWIVVGLIAGLLAKFLLPGDGPGGLILTTLIGMAGAVVGGVLIGVIGGAGLQRLVDPGGYPGSGHAPVRLPAANGGPKKDLIPKPARGTSVFRTPR